MSILARLERLFGSEYGVDKYHTDNNPSLHQMWKDVINTPLEGTDINGKPLKDQKPVIKYGKADDRFNLQ